MALLLTLSVLNEKNQKIQNLASYPIFFGDFFYIYYEFLPHVREQLREVHDPRWQPAWGLAVFAEV
jgi:hypothetical protein